jgi:hypothetical protein
MPAQVTKPRILTFGGGDEATSMADDSRIGFAVMCNIELRTEEREQSVCRPLYEYALNKRMYELRGGSAKLNADWLVDKVSGKDAYPRTVDLTRHVLRKEQERLQSAFRIMRANGQTRSLFDEVFGIGSANRFADVVRDQAKAYRALALTYQQLNTKLPNGKKRKPTLEEWQAIADLSLPPSAGVDRIEVIEPLDDEVEGLAPVVDDVDPSMDLQNFLTEREVAPEIAAAIAQAYAKDKKVTKGALNRIPALLHKPQLVAELMTLVRQWKAPEAPAAVEKEPELLGVVTAPTAAAIEADLAE